MRVCDRECVMRVCGRECAMGCVCGGECVMGSVMGVCDESVWWGVYDGSV